MKKLLLSSLIASGFLFALPSIAQVTAQKGGFVDPSMTVVTVAQAEKMKDDSRVILRGQIEKRIKGDNYLFKDSTGSIKVDIDDDKWNGLTVNPQDMVEITGEVDKGWIETEIDVKHIIKVEK